MIRINNLKKSYSSELQALNGVSFDIRKGEFIAILGPSGAGKSTLVRCINGLVKADEGEIYFNNERLEFDNPAMLKRARKSIATIFQQFNLIERRDALTNVLMGRLGQMATLPSIFGLFSDSDYQLAISCLRRVGLESHQNSMARSLSGGQQQRVAIARALVQSPLLLLGDEPVASLDPVTAKSILALIKEINKRDNITILLNMHSVELSIEFADRIIGLKDGRIVFDGAAKEITPEILEEIYV